MDRGNRLRVVEWTALVRERVAVPLIVVALASSIASAQSTTAMSVSSGGQFGDNTSGDPAISADGRIVGFDTLADNLVANDANHAPDVFVRDLVAGTIELVSVDSSGVQANAEAFGPCLSSDGRFVAFSSLANNLVSDDRNPYVDAFLRDRLLGTTMRVSVDSNGSNANGDSFAASISADGRFVAFVSYATDIDPLDFDRAADVYVRDLQTGATVLVSVPPSGRKVAYDSDSASLSADARFVAFRSAADNLVANDTNDVDDVFVRDLATSTTSRVNLSASGAESDAPSSSPRLSSDASTVAFDSLADNLVVGDHNSASDVFAVELATGAIDLVSRNAQGEQGRLDSTCQSIDATGRRVCFASASDNLVPGFGGHSFIFVFDRAARFPACVSVADDGSPAQGGSWHAAMSTDARTIAFDSSADNLVAGDDNSAIDVFARERVLATAAWSNYGSGLAGTRGVPTLTASAPPALNSSITLALDNSRGRYTVGLLLFGTSQAAIPGWQGTLLVAPDLLLPIVLPPAGFTATDVVPPDDRFDGLTLFLQGLQSDPGAPAGVSFSPGLELDFGY